MRDYRIVISEMKRKAQMPGDAPFVAIDDDLYTLLQDNFDGSVASVAATILSGGRNQVGRMAAAFGPSHLPKFFFFLKSLIESGKNFNGLRELYDITKEAYEFTKGGSDENIETKPATPQTYEEMMRIPMHSDVKDVKSHYRSMIKNRYK